MDRKKKAIVLGGTAPHAELIRKLKGRGYETILIDYFSDSAAKKYADRHIQESTLDEEKVLQIAKDEQVDMVISVCIDHANVTACYVAEKLGLPHPYSYETALNLTKKGRMKKIFRDNGIPTSDYYTVGRTDEPKALFPFPVVIKPTDANSSKGVFLVHDESEFVEKISSSFSYSREGRVIVEEYVEGTEIQVDCIAVDGVAHVLMVKDMVPMDYGIMQVTGYMSPGEACTRHLEQIREVAQQIVDAFGLKTTAFFYQAKCNEKGVSVLEFAGRCAGGSAYAVVSLRTGMDYLELAMKAFLQEKIELEYTPSNKIFAGEFLFMKPGIFHHLEGIEELIGDGIIDYVFPCAIKGMKVDISLLDGNRTAVIMAVCDSYDEGREKIDKALERIKTIDPEGRDLSYWRNDQ